MGRKFATIFYISATTAILLYAAIRFAIGTVGPRRAVIISGKMPPPGLVKFITSNLSDSRTLPKKIVRVFPEIGAVTVQSSGDMATVRLWHKKIVAAWSDGTHFYPLSDGGIPITTPLSDRPHAPVFRGMMPRDMTPIIAAAANIPVELIEYFEFVEERRWNMHLFGGAVVMLPERNFGAAIDSAKAAGIFDKSFEFLDLRDPKRMLMK